MINLSPTLATEKSCGEKSERYAKIRVMDIVPGESTPFLNTLIPLKHSI